MNERMVRWLPTALGGVFLAIGLGAVGFASSGLSLSITPPEEPASDADPVVLLRDDVAALSSEVDLLRKGTGEGIQALGRHLDANAEERHEELLEDQKKLVAEQKKLVAEVARMTRANENVRTELALARAEVRALRVDLGKARASGKPPGSGLVQVDPPELKLDEPPSSKAKKKKKDEPDDDEGMIQIDPPELKLDGDPEEEPEPKAKRKRRKRGLFSFKLKGGGPDFTTKQRYQVIASLSRVGFDAKSTLHDFSGVTSDVKGKVVLAIAGKTPSAKGEVRAKVATLKTGVEGRDKEMKEVLGAGQHPEIVFSLEGLKATKVDTKARSFEGEVEGTFTVKGKTKSVRVPVKASVDSSKRLVVKGQAPLEMSEFGLDVPSPPGVEVEDEIKMWISLRLRCLGAAK